MRLHGCRCCPAERAAILAKPAAGKTLQCSQHVATNAAALQLAEGAAECLTQPPPIAADMRQALYTGARPLLMPLLEVSIAMPGCGSPACVRVRQSLLHMVFCLSLHLLRPYRPACSPTATWLCSHLQLLRAEAETR